MSFLELTKKRKTTYEFSDKKIKAKDIKTILEAGRWAPSCSNSQPWHFIIIKEKEMIENIMMTANYGDFHYDPPIMIALVLLCEKCPGEGYICFRGKDSGVEDSFISIGMAGLNMVLQATDLGINSAIITPTPEITKKILKVREEDTVPIVILLGYENKDTYQKKREREKLSNLISYEYFGGNNDKS